MTKKISIQAGMQDIETLLKSEGYEVVAFGHDDMDADVSIINDVDMSYEEIEPAQCRTGLNGKEMLVINASNMTPNKVLELVNKNMCDLK